MKPELIYQNLVELAEKLDITVQEQNLRKSGITVQSGLCKVKEQSLYIMDKHKSIRDKVNLLADCLKTMPHENIYVIPAVRELLNNKCEVPKV